MSSAYLRHRVNYRFLFIFTLCAALPILPVFLACGPRTVDSALVADAGKDTRTFVGKPVKLDGSGSKDLKGRSFDYVWTIVQKPSGSKATLQNDRTAQPVLTPDQAGRFVVQLKITDGTFNSEAVSANVDADFPPAAFLQIVSWAKVAANGRASDYAIQLGEITPSGTPLQTYTAPDFPGTIEGELAGFMMLVLNRSDGTVVEGYPRSYYMGDGTQINALTKDINDLGLGKDKLVILSSLSSATGNPLSSYSDLVTAIQGLGASSSVANVSGGDSYSLIGVNGTASGSAYEYYGSQHGDSATPAIIGKLIRDPTQNFRFMYDYLPFETRTEDASNPDIPLNSIVIGPTVYPLPSGAVADSSNGGFHVLILNRETLAKISQNFYQLNKGNVAQTGEFQRMANDLYPVKSTSPIVMRNDYLFIISSVGTLPNIFGTFNTYYKSKYYPNSPAQSLEWAFDLLGGAPGVFAALDPDQTYSLVGTGPGTTYNTSLNPNYDYTLNFTRVPDTNFPIVSVESSSVKTPGISADLRGLLTKDNLGWYSAQLSDGGGSKSGMDYSLLPIALQNPVSWNGPGTDKETRIYQDISIVLLQGLSNVDHPDDVRQYYYRTDFSWSDRRTDLAFMTCDRLKAWAPDTTLDCTDSDTINAFNTMQMNLLKEVEMRDDLQSWFYTDLTQLLEGVENSQVVDLATDYQNALTFTTVDQKKTVGMTAMSFVVDILTTASGFIAMFAAVPVIDMPPQAIKKGAFTSGGLGVLAGLVSLGKDIYALNHPAQTNNLPGEVKDAAVNLWKDMVSQYINTQANLDQAFLLITSDWGRMQALHNIYSGLYDKSQYLNVLQAMEPGANASFYKTLLPVVFSVEVMPYDAVYSSSKTPPKNPCNFYVCDSKGDSEHYEDCPSGGRPSDSLLTAQNLWYMEYSDGSNFTNSFYTVWKGNSGSSSNYYDDTNINLFKPVNQGGYGVSMYDFAARWPFTYSFPSHWSDACNCSPTTRPCPPQD